MDKPIIKSTVTLAQGQENISKLFNKSLYSFLKLLHICINDNSKYIVELYFSTLANNNIK